MKLPIILAIDTSCDETAAAVTMGRRVLSNVISSQVDIHTKYGGVYPALAKRAHIERIGGVVNEALRRASITYHKMNSATNSNNKSQIHKLNSNIINSKQSVTINDNLVTISDGFRLDAIAVTQGPGLAIALEVGITKAKGLVISTKSQAPNSKQTQITQIQKPKQNNNKQKAKSNDLPLIAVNHLEGHILSTIAQNSMGNPKREIDFPALALVVSGGNTQMLFVRKIGKYEMIGETLDDACGEALDKAARILQLGYPGGPIIERLALTGDHTKYVLKPTLTAKNNFNFSYSGLKTAFLYLVNKLPKEEFNANLNNLAASFQYQAFEQLTRKLTRAIDVYQPKSILCGGGVIANRYLRNILHCSTSKNNLPLYFPTNKLLYGDNAAMIGIAAYYKYLQKEFIAPEDIDRKPSWKLEAPKI